MAHNSQSLNCSLEEIGVKKSKYDSKEGKIATGEISNRKVKVGSRKSQLALFQTNFVVDLLKQNYPKLSYEIKTMTTTGDKILDVALSKIGEKSLFTKELEVALENREVHMVVHSLKDLPTTLPDRMVIGAICKRENPCDVVIFRPDLQCQDLNNLPPKSVIGTSSLRRIAQLKRHFPHLEFQSIRGNLNTRFRKLDEDNVYSAIVLAAAGVHRLDLSHRIGQYLKPDICMHAVGQGALGIECKEDDWETLELLAQIADLNTTLCCIAERSFMRKLEGGCSVPIAVSSAVDDNELMLEGGVFSLDGSQSICQKLTTSLAKTNKEPPKKNFVGVVSSHMPWNLLYLAEDLGVQLADLLLKMGAKEILTEARAYNSIS